MPTSNGGIAPRSAGASAAREAAPALFRLLSDSALFRAAMAASRVPLALLEAGRGLGFVFVNPAFERLSGYAERDTLGRPANLALEVCGDETSLGRLLATNDDVAVPATGLRIACCVRRRDGSERAVLATFDPVRDKGGRVTHWIVALDDAPATA